MFAFVKAQLYQKINVSYSHACCKLWWHVCSCNREIALSEDQHLLTAVHASVKGQAALASTQSYTWWLVYIVDARIVSTDESADADDPLHAFKHNCNRCNSLLYELQEEQ